MQNTKIGNTEAIAIIVIIMINNAILNVTKSIISNIGTASILNTIYISIIAIFLSYYIYILFKNFPTFDILDISNVLGGKFLKYIIGILYLVYFILFSSILLNSFAYCLQIIYYPSTDLFFISLFFIIGTIFCCSLRYNSIYRSNLLIIPILLIGTICILVLNFKNFSLENIFPILGRGFNNTFIKGTSSLFAFQCIAFLYFIPSILKKPSSLKKICITSIVISSIFLILCTTIISLMFNAFIDSHELVPLFSAVRFIQYGNFFQRIDSIFILMLIISFISYLCIIVSTCCNISQKLLPTKSSKYYVYIFSFIILIVSILPKNQAISAFISNTICKYIFFILTIGISFLILIFSNIKRKVLLHKKN